MSKFIPMREFHKAYKKLAKLGFTPTGNAFCTAKKEICPIMALNLANRVGKLPDDWRDKVYDGEIALKFVQRKFGVSKAFVDGVLVGMDFPNSHHDATESGVKHNKEDFVLGVKQGNLCNRAYVK